MRARNESSYRPDGVPIARELKDFEATLDSARAGDFVFVDPPYTVKHNLNGFLKYNDKIFSWADQLRLRDAVPELQCAGRWS